MSKVEANNGSIILPDRPLKCPACATLMIPYYYYAIRGENGVDVLSQCSNSECQQSFISVFELYFGSYEWRRYRQLPMLTEVFSDIINEISPTFVEIYNQAYATEQMNLNSICGVGYRKALEFLVKDFAIKEEPSDEEKIKIMPLQQCISKYIKNSQVKPIIERAVWLGNDETHYVRKWESKDVKDLKGLISLSVYWIEAEIKSRKVLEDMGRES